MLLNENYFGELIDYAKLLINENKNDVMKINPLSRSIGFMESIKYLRSFHSFNDPYIYYDFMARKATRNSYKKVLELYLNDFKA